MIVLCTVQYSSFEGNNRFIYIYFGNWLNQVGFVHGCKNQLPDVPMQFHIQTDLCADILRFFYVLTTSCK